MKHAALALAFFALTGCASMAPTSTRFKILQLNDVYKIEGLEKGQSGGMARVRTLRKQLESDGTAVLILHAGDLLFPSVMSKYLEARPMVDVMNLLDGDDHAFDPALIVTPGNHELDPKDPQILLRSVQESQFPWVSTNTIRCNPMCDQRFEGMQETILRDVDGTRIGIMGLLYPVKKTYAQSTDVKAAARAAAANLRMQGARVVIAITHQDMGQDVEMLEDVPGIDIVIGGHDHLFMQDRVKGTWITKADADAKSVIVYDVTVPRTGPVRTAPLRVVLDSTIAKDPAVDARVQHWLQTLGEKLGGDEPIAVTKNLLEGVEPAVRGRETALGNLLTDIMREHMQTDVALLNGGSIRINDNIPPGPITRYDMEGIFYYTNGLVAFPLTGAQLLDMLRNSVSRADAGDGRFLQVSGLRFTYHAADGAFTVNPEDVEVGGKPLDLSAIYTVASLDYMYLHGSEDGYTIFDDATRPGAINRSLEADFRKTVESALQARGTVDVDIEGRIVRK